MKPIKYNFYTKEDSSIRRIHTELATEIGFNESIILLQFDHLINVENNYKIYEGRYWTYDSIKNLQDKFFPFWGTTTIKKTIKNLESKNLIIKANYNKAGFDKTNWYTVNYEEAAKLKSIIIGYKDEKGCAQPLVGKCPTNSQDLTNDESESDHPIPETSSEKSSETSSCTSDFKKSDDVGCNVSDAQDMENPFFKKYKEIKNKIENKKYLELKNTKNQNIGNIKKFNRRSERKGIKLGDEEIFAALKVYNELDRDDHPFLFEYIEHESQLWDFSKTKNPAAVTAQFVLECLDNAPTFLHFCKLRKNGDLNEEIRHCTVELKNTPSNNENKTLLEMAMEMSPPSY
jgi:hypothetical protein